MNDKCECVAVLDETDPRAAIWREVVPDLRMPLEHPISHNATDEKGNIKRFLSGDPSKLTDFQKARYAEAVGKAFNVHPSEVMKSLQSGVLPILYENITIIFCNLHSRCAM